MKYTVIIKNPNKKEGFVYDEGDCLPFLEIYKPTRIEISSGELGLKLYELIKYGFDSNLVLSVEYNTSKSALHLNK